MLPYLLSNFEIQKYNQNEPKLKKFCGVYSKNNSSKIRDGTCIINFDKYESIETHWIAFYVNAENVTYFDGFRAEYTGKN